MKHVARWGIGLSLACASVLAGGPAAAQLSGRVALGAGYLPDYQGSDDYGFVPYPEFEIDDGNYSVDFRGGALRANLLDSKSFHAGPLIGFARARKDVADPRVRRMHELDRAFTAGGFVEYQHRAKDPRSGERVSLSVEQRFAGQADAGLAVTARALAHRPVTFVDRGLIGTVEVDATWANDDDMQTYFDVSPADAAASGLPAFRARGGLRNVGLAFSLDQYLSRRWSVGLRTHYSRLLGDAADSPLTRIAGSPNQVFAGVVVGYRFGRSGGL
jgi:outer membrane scaffolding protein for murein synthesis (MipA/OmpV family)